MARRRGRESRVVDQKRAISRCSAVSAFTVSYTSTASSKKALSASMENGGGGPGSQVSAESRAMQRLLPQ
jgi:hypothetical protein